MKRKIKNTLTLILFVFGIAITHAQTNPGDIAFVAFNADGNDNIAFVTFVDIPANTAIWFTDNEWNGVDAFNDLNEGETKWIHNALVPAGTVISFDRTGTASLGTVTAPVGFVNLNASNEDLFALLSEPSNLTMAAPGFLAGISNDNISTLANTGLTLGVDFIDFNNDHDGFEYIGPRSGEANFSNYLPLIMNTANWQDETTIGNNILPIDLTVFTISGGLTVVSLVGTTSTIAEDGVSIDVCVAITNPDATNVTTVELDLNVGSTTTNGSDYTTITYPQTLIFPAGSSVNQCLTITITDDVLIEVTETLILNLQNPSGGNSATLGSNTQHTVSITDNDTLVVNQGDIIITEIMQNPSAVSDAAGEYFEVFNTTAAAIDMVSWTITDNGGQTHTISGSLVVPAGGYIVLGKSTDTATNGNITVDYAYGSDIGLLNADDELILTSDIGNEIDRVEYDGGILFPDPTGKSMNLNTDSLNFTANNDGTNWCESTSAIGNGDFGTPGVANDTCPIPCILTLGTVDAICNAETAGIDTYDVSIDFTVGATTTYTITTTSGTIGGDNPSLVASGTITIANINEGTDIVVTIDNLGTPGGTCDFTININGIICVTPVCEPVGSLIFTEIMQNPNAVVDNLGEWFEIHNTTASSIDLFGWSIIDDNHTLAEEGFFINTSLIIPANGYLLFANNADALTNGGLPAPDFVYDPILTLGNGFDGLTIQCSGTIIDSVIWDNGLNFPDPSGKSMTLRSNKFNDTDNDLGASWCIGTTAYGDGDLGTPNATNDDCACVNLDVVTWTAGAWSNGTGPTIDNKVIIDDAFNTSTNGDFESCDCQINAGKTLTVAANGFYKAVYDIVNNGTIIVEDTGSIVQVSDNATVTGTDFQIKKTTTPYVMYDFTYWSSPVESADIGIVFAANLPNRIYDFTTVNFDDTNNDTFDDNNDDWNVASGIMTNAKGYIVMGEGAIFPVPATIPTTTSQQAVSFNGKINNGIKTIVLNVDANATDNFDNQNLIGNPYPSAIDAVKFLDATTNPNLSGTLYFWTHNTQVSSSAAGPDTYNFTNDDYMTYVSGTGFVAGACSGCVVPVDDLIASGQGFFADVIAAGTATFNNDMRVTTGNDNFFRSSETKDRIWVNFTNEEGMFRQTLVGFFADATNGPDRNYDGKRLENGNNFDFYSLMNTKRYAIQGFATLANDKTVSLGIEAPIVGDFQISIDHLEGDLENVNVYLKDNLFNTLHDLKEGAYNLTIGQVGEFNERFELLFSRTALAVTNNTIVSENDLMVSNLNNDIHFEIRNGNIIRKVQAYDIIGKLLFEATPNNNNFNIQTNIPKGTVLFIKTQLENGQTLTKKFVRL